jgi:hypothetical protein
MHRAFEFPVFNKVMKHLPLAFFLLLAPSVWAQGNVESWNHDTGGTQINIPCGPSTAPSGQQEWTASYPVADNHQNSVTVSFTSGKFRYDGGAYQVAYRFKNGYEAPVDFDVEFVTQTGGKTTKSVESYANVAPGMETKTNGRWTICQTMVSVRMKFIRVGHPGAQQGGRSPSRGPAMLVYDTCDKSPDDLEHKCNVNKLNCNKNSDEWCTQLAKSHNAAGTAAYSDAYDACMSKHANDCQSSQSQCLASIRRCPSGQSCSAGSCR